MKISFEKAEKIIKERVVYDFVGKVLNNRGQILEVSLPNAKIGSKVIIKNADGLEQRGEVIGIKRFNSLIMPYEEIDGVNSQSKIKLDFQSNEIKISDNILGRVLDSELNPLDDLGIVKGPFEKKSIYGKFINPMDRPVISETLDTGISAINSFITVGKGQRCAIMAGSGVGKSVLLGMMARYTASDVNVIALVGERGREVLEFIKNDLGEEGLKKSVIIVATSDQGPLLRMRSAYVATTIAEYFRDQKKDVLFMMDSVTRFAMANREVALALGEIPGQKGYAPSVFSKLPKLIERVGTKKDSGTITGIYSVLVEGGDLDEPISDAVRGIVDGHIVLSRELATKGHYPAIDVLGSISRLMNNITTKEHRVIANHLRDLLSAYKENEELIAVGAYSKGSNQRVDKAIEVYQDLQHLLKQPIEEHYRIEYLYDQMVEIARKAEMSVNSDLIDTGPKKTKVNIL